MGDSGFVVVIKCLCCGEENSIHVELDSGTQGMEIYCNECGNEETKYY